jgi:hypothetical protein
MRVLIRPVFQHMLKTLACFPLNLRRSLSMLQCSKWLDLEAFGLYDPRTSRDIPSGSGFILMATTNRADMLFSGLV